MPTVIAPRETETPARQPLPLYNVIAHNCDCHTFDDVIIGLVRVLGMSAREAMEKAIEIDHYGRGVVAQTHRELAEHYAERLSTEVISAANTRLRTSVAPAA